MRIWEALLMGVIPIGDASSLADRMLQAEGYPLASARGRLGAYFGGSSRHVAQPSVLGTASARLLAEFHSVNCYTQVHH